MMPLVQSWTNENSLTNWGVVTFGAGKTWSRASKRLSRQIFRSGVFRHFQALDEKWLAGMEMPQTSDVPIEAKFIRGYGLWHWKPFSILEMFQSFPDLEGVLYLDSGCEFNNKSQALTRLSDYIEMAQKTGSLAFVLPVLEKDYTSPFVLSAIEDKRVTSENQISATILFFSRTQENILFIREWANWCTKDNFKYLIGDAPIAQLDFREHRHDQSILSLLWKNAQKTSINDETYWAPNWKIDGSHFPIWAARNSSYYSIRLFKFLRTPLRLSEKIIRMVRTL